MARVADGPGLLAPDACRLERPVLRDPVLQEQLEQRGYVVIPLVGPDEVQTLYQGYLRGVDRADGINPPGAYDDTYAEFSVIHSRPVFRRDAYELITSVLVPRATST